MRRVLVIGSPGAGKSTFARKLQGATGLPLYYLDMLWHRPDRTNVSEAEFDAALGAILGTDRWIVDGNYLRTLERRLRACDTVFLFDIPAALCMEGAASRVGTPREDIPWVEEDFDEEFRRQIEEFPQKELPLVRAALSRCGAGKKIVEFSSRRQSDEYIDGILHNKK